MKIFKWIIGFLFAFLISFGLIMGFAYLDPVNNFVNRNITYYCIYHLFTMITCFSIFAFLSCYFVPAPKKYAGLVAVSLSFLFIVFALYVDFTDKYFQGYVDIKFFINYIGMMAGLSIGFYISYEKFKNRGWGAPKNLAKNKEVY
jgi:hypothetical protein